jgi:hypothetical protein
MAPIRKGENMTTTLTLYHATSIKHANEILPARFEAPKFPVGDVQFTATPDLTVKALLRLCVGEEEITAYERSANGKREWYIPAEFVNGRFAEKIPKCRYCDKFGFHNNYYGGVRHSACDRHVAKLDKTAKRYEAKQLRKEQQAERKLGDKSLNFILAELRNAAKTRAALQYTDSKIDNAKLDKAHQAVVRNYLLLGPLVHELAKAGFLHVNVVGVAGLARVSAAPPAPVSPGSNVKIASVKVISPDSSWLCLDDSDFIDTGKYWLLNIDVPKLLRKNEEENRKTSKPIKPCS